MDSEQFEYDEAFHQKLLSFNVTGDFKEIVKEVTYKNLDELNKCFGLKQKDNISFEFCKDNIIKTEYSILLVCIYSDDYYDNQKSYNNDDSKVISETINFNNKYFDKEINISKVEKLKLKHFHEICSDKDSSMCDRNITNKYKKILGRDFFHFKRASGYRQLYIGFRDRDFRHMYRRRRQFRHSEESNFIWDDDYEDQNAVYNYLKVINYFKNKFILNESIHIPKNNLTENLNKSFDNLIEILTATYSHDKELIGTVFCSLEPGRTIKNGRHFPVVRLLSIKDKDFMLINKNSRSAYNYILESIFVYIYNYLLIYVSTKDPMIIFKFLIFYKKYIGDKKNMLVYTLLKELFINQKKTLKQTNLVEKSEFYTFKKTLFEYYFLPDAYIDNKWVDKYFDKLLIYFDDLVLNQDEEIAQSCNKILVNSFYKYKRVDKLENIINNSSDKEIVFLAIEKLIDLYIEREEFPDAVYWAKTAITLNIKGIKEIWETKLFYYKDFERLNPKCFFDGSNLM